MEKIKEALDIVVTAAGIHCDRLTETLEKSHRGYGNDSFNTARLQYIRKTQADLRVVKGLKLDEELKIKERVSDLSLEESVDLMLALEDRIRTLRQHNRSEFQ